MFFTCINCIIQYFLSERLINNPCFRNFGQPFFPPPFVFIIFSCRQLKNANSFCSTRSTTANYSTVYSWHFRRHVVLKPSCVILSVHCYCHVTTIKSDQNIRRKIPMFPNQGSFRVTMVIASCVFYLCVVQLALQRLLLSFSNLY